MNLAAQLLSIVSLAGAVLGVDHRDARRPPAPCSADSSFRRLSFWVGDWTVYDSTGKQYASQRVRDILDQCAITAEWASGGGNKGLGIFAYDVRSGGWRQMYVSNQTPQPSGIVLRQSDPTYTGPGVRFVAMDPPRAGAVRSRITIAPSPGGVTELFEDSRDDGQTWITVFKAEHRPAQ